MDQINPVDEIIIARYLFWAGEGNLVKLHTHIVKYVYDDMKQFFKNGQSPVRVSPFRIEQALRKQGAPMEHFNGFPLRGERNGYMVARNGVALPVSYLDPDYYLDDVARMGQDSFEDVQRWGNAGFEEVEQRAIESRQDWMDRYPARDDDTIF